ncbi:MAG: gliding motility-associated C-terminal domain-containing protein [Fluviicola sp.]|jgi:gliding motility-associated-like protein
MKALFLTFFVFSIQFSFAQTVDCLNVAGHFLSDKATRVVMDNEGNTYMTGYYNEEATFGSIVIPFSNPHSKEVFIAKIDPNGNFLWVKNGVNYYDDRGLGICLDNNNNVYVTGTCWGGIQFGPLYASTPSSYTDNIFFVKLDSDGNFLHLEVVGCDEGDDHGLDVEFDGIGSVYVTGFISGVSFFPDGIDGIANFGSIAVNAPEDSLAFLAKFEIATNNWTWVRTFDGDHLNKENRVAVDRFGNPYICGGYKGTVNFGANSLTSNGSRDIFVTKYDPLGNHVYAVSAGGPLEDRADGIAIGLDDHVYLTGEFRDKAIFGSDTINNNGGPNGADIFVSRMDLNGTWKWAKKAGSDGGKDRGTDICVNNKFNIFVSGQFKHEAKFGGDIDLIDTSSVQFFVAAIDTLGKWRWAKQGGGPNDDRGSGIACDTSCNLVTCGYFEDECSFESEFVQGITNFQIKKDIFVAKIEDACFGYDTPPVVPIDEPIFCETIEGNVFTPNNDGANDEYEFVTTCNSKNMSVSIVNRWGNEIYTSKDLNQAWNGKDKNGNLVTEGVYFYSLNYKSENGADVVKKGYISVFF